MADSRGVEVGARVEVAGKDVCGRVAFMGSTSFSSGRWVGVVLDEPKGKNNGTVQGRAYFSCAENHGIFVRQSQLKLLEEEPGSEAPAQAKPLGGCPCCARPTGQGGGQQLSTREFCAGTSLSHRLCD